MATTASRSIESHHPETKALSSWFARFKSKPTKKEAELPRSESRSQRRLILGIFNVPLQESITYANVAISLYNDSGQPFIYGYIPIVVAKCGLFLKENATETEGIFRLSGSAKRIKDLQAIFDEPPKYGKGHDWDGFTVHDAANILRRDLNHLPDPIIPFDWYDAFREPLKQTWPAERAIPRMQELVASLPPLNRQLLLYILDLLAVFASKSDINRMTSENLAAIFQPGVLTHPRDDMAPQEYRLSQEVLVFLIDNQANFLLDMCPPTGEQTPSAPAVAQKVILRRRTLQTARKTPESKTKDGPSPLPTASAGASLSRSNTLPSRRNAPDVVQGPRHVSVPTLHRGSVTAITEASIPEVGTIEPEPVSSFSTSRSSLNAPTADVDRKATSPIPISREPDQGLPMPLNSSHALERPVKAREIKSSSSPSKFGNFFKKKSKVPKEGATFSTVEASTRRDLDQ